MYSRLFRSRWSALFWAAGVIWTAYDIADAAPTPAPTNSAAANSAAAQDATGEQIDPAALAILANMSGN